MGKERGAMTLNYYFFYIYKIHQKNKADKGTYMHPRRGKGAMSVVQCVLSEVSSQFSLYRPKQTVRKGIILREDTYVHVKAVTKYNTQ